MKDRKIPPITASNIDEFNKIVDLLNGMNEKIFNQVEAVRFDGFFNAKVRFKRWIKENVYLPESTTQISDNGDYIGVYAEGYLIEIPVTEAKERYSYVFTTDK